MKLRYKILNGTVIFMVVAIAALAVVVSHDSACEPAPAVAGDTETMKAVVYRCYGAADVLTLEDIAMPVLAGEEFLVKVQAASVNPLDWHYMRGSPYLMRFGTGLGKPIDTRLGVDFAGTVVATGAAVTRFRPGDEVFGGRTGAFGEYVTLRETSAVVPKPANISFAQAAAAPIAAVTALQALRDTGKIAAGDRVLINGASGGVGTFAVQIAKTFGADVTGVCSTRNLEMVRSIGADQVVDYTKENYTESGQRYDLIVDMVGNHSVMANRRALTENGRLVMVGGPKGDWLSPMMAPIKALLLSPFVDQEMGMMLADLSQEDLTALGELMAAGEVTPVIDRVYRLDEVPQAIEYSESGRARGKIIVDLQ